MWVTGSNANSCDLHYFGLTRWEYQRLVVKALSRFEPVLFTAKGLSAGQIVWRHDVDRNPISALEIAKTNNRLGLQATFFIRTRSENYNFFDPGVQTILDQIEGFGQVLGLHYEPSVENLRSKRALESGLQRELNLWGVARTSRVHCFAFHNTSPNSLKFDELTYAGLLNAYALEFKQNNRYVSDSGGKWRFENLGAVLESPEIDRLQVLIHTDWWNEVDSPPFSKIHLSAYRDFERTINKYIEDVERAGLPVEKGIAALVPSNSDESIGIEPGTMQMLWNLRRFRTVTRLLGENPADLLFGSNGDESEIESYCLSLLKKKLAL